MSTLKLKKPANADAQGGARRDTLKPARAPVRQANANRIRPTLQQAQRERAARDDRFKQDAEGRRGAPDARGPRSDASRAPGEARRDGSAPVRRAPENQGGVRGDPRSEPRFEGRPPPRSESRRDSEPAPRNNPRPDARGPSRGDRPVRSAEGARHPTQAPARDPRDRDPRDGPRTAFGNQRAETPYRHEDGRNERNGRGEFAARNDRGGQAGPSRNDRPDGRGPSPQWKPRKDIAPRGSAPVGGRDRRPDLRLPRHDSRADARPDVRADVRPALPPEPELRSEAEHAAFPGRPTGAPPEHVQGTKPALEGVRLSKRMSELGLASRREADEWIQRGWVRVDGVVVSTLGSRVMPEQQVEIDPRAVGQQSQRVTVLLNKPAGYVSGQAEDGHQPANVLCTPDHRSATDKSGITYTREHVKGIAPAGRLDMDSTGLLVYTQDGRVAKQLIGGDASIEKEYVVRVENEKGVGQASGLSDEALALLNHGIELDGVPLRPAEVSWLNDEQLRFVLREGKKRQIRRMCEAVGLQVLELQRVRIGNITLGDLAEGEWRYLGPDESFA